MTRTSSWRERSECRRLFDSSNRPNRCDDTLFAQFALIPRFASQKLFLIALNSGRSPDDMIIGVPKEIKNHEYRVEWPFEWREAVRHGHGFG